MEKIKALVTNCIQSEKGKDVLTLIIVILVGLGSFELGRLSKGTQSSGIKIEYPNGVFNQPANVVSFAQSNNATTATPTGKQFFASSRGSKYYSLGCSGGKTIKQENRVYFSTSAEAEAAGFELSSSCK